MTVRLWFIGLVVVATPVLDPLTLVEPTVALSARERARLDRGELVSRVLPAHKGQVAMFAASQIAVDPETLVMAANDIADLRKSSFVTAIKRFSAPPQLSDLDELTLDAYDRSLLAACEVGRCSFKLAAVEIDAIKRARAGDVNGDRIAAALRSVMLERVRGYLAAGLPGLPPIANRSNTWRLHDVLAAMNAESPRLLREPPLSEWILDSRASIGPTDSFLYWSKEHFGSGKPVIVITHVATYRIGRGTAIVVGKQIFSSRYMNGALALTAIGTAESGQRYLVYLNRTTVDLLGGLLGGLKRAALESRLAAEAPELISALRSRLERSDHVSRSPSVRND